MYLRRWLALVLALTLVAAACGDDGGGDDGANGGDGGSSSIEVSGSSTVEPITARVAQAFTAANPDVGIRVEGPGTGDGFRRFCAGETDISDASRPITAEETEACEAAGIEYVELRVAIDGLTVLTSTANDAVSCLAFDDLYALLGPESTGFGNWSDADALAAELGAPGAPYPDAPLVVTAPGEESGTYDTFVEFVIEDRAEERGEEGATRPDYTPSANDNTIITGIAGTDTSLGWVGYAFFVENQDTVQAIEIMDDAGACVAPTAETIASGAYPLSRDLFIYVSTTKAAESQALTDYVDFYLSEEGLVAVDDAGYVRLSDYEPVRSAWESR